MKVETLTEEQFLNLADSATQETFTNLTSMAVLKNRERNDHTKCKR